MANTGVDVSLGRVTKAYETIPVMARPPKVRLITQGLVTLAFKTIHERAGKACFSTIIETLNLVYM